MRDSASADLKEFSNTTIDLQDRLHIAAYDPEPLISASQAKVALEGAARAILLFDAIAVHERALFLTQPIFKRRF